MIYEFRCKKCELVQEKIMKMDEELKEGCENPECDAEAEDLERILSTFPKHGSWGNICL